MAGASASYAAGSPKPEVVALPKLEAVLAIGGEVSEDANCCITGFIVRKNRQTETLTVCSSAGCDAALDAWLAAAETR